MEQFYYYLAENDVNKKSTFTDSLKVCELIAKYTMCAKSPIYLRTYINNQKTPGKNLKGVNPIRVSLFQINYLFILRILLIYSNL